MSIPFRTGQDVLADILAERELGWRDLGLIRRDLSGDPRYSNIMKFVKHRYPSLMAEDPLGAKLKDPLVNKFKSENYENTPEGWAQFETQFAPDLQGKTIRDVLASGKPKMAPSYTMTDEQGRATKFPTQIPATNPNWAFMPNRGNFGDGEAADWYRIGDPLDQQRLGAATMETLRGLPNYTGRVRPEYHGKAVAIEPAGRRLNQILSSQGINPPGQDQQLTSGNEARYNWAQHSADIADNPNAWEQSSPEQQQVARGWIQNNTAKRNPAAVGTGTNPMTISNMPPPVAANAGNASAGATELAATGAGTLGKTGAFANRALPVMNLALLAGMMMQNSRANRENRYAEQSQKTMRT